MPGLLRSSWRSRTFRYNVAGPTKVKLMCRVASVERWRTIGIRDAGARHGWKTNAFPLFWTGRWRGSCCWRGSRGLTRGAQLAADLLKVVAYPHAAMRDLPCAACRDVATRDVVRTYPCPRLHRPGHLPLDSRCCPRMARSHEAAICGRPSGKSGGRRRRLSDLLLGLFARDFLHPRCRAAVAIS